MKIENEVTLSLSGAYSEQNFLCGEVLHLEDMDETCCYCGSCARAELTVMLAPFPAEGLHWIDSGDYHYLSLLWMEKHREEFALLLFDHHPDDQACAFGAELLSCGSWVAEAADLPLMRSSLTIGPVDNDNRADLSAWLDSLPAGLPLHISIDKDVLGREYARTDWDQGKMTLPELLELLRLAVDSHPVLAVDICGELSAAKGACGEDVDINASTNRILRDFFLTLRN